MREVFRWVGAAMVILMLTAPVVGAQSGLLAQPLDQEDQQLARLFDLDLDFHSTPLARA